jgi:BlaI family transcriptional regulator, penicillinase repressor
VKTPKSITDAELAVVKFLWDHPAATAKAIAEGLYQESTTSDVGTVHSLLQRLESKHFVQRDRSGHSHRFSAAVSQADLAGLHLNEIAEKLSAGSFKPFLTHLVEDGRMSDDEIEELRQLLDQHKPRRRKP